MQIRLGTLNAWAMPGPLARDVSYRIDAIGEKLPDYHLDAIAFQEVWTSDACRSLQRAGVRAGLVHSWAGDVDSWAQGTERGGLLILSRLPIEDVRFETFALRGEPERAITNLEYLSGKGFATVKLRTPEGPIRLINTHLHAGYGQRAHHYIPHRTAQAIQIAARHADSNVPIVAVGDFNFREGEPDYRILTGLLSVRDAAVELDRRHNTTLTSNPYRNGRTDRRKDFVFVRDGAAAGLAARRIERAFEEQLEVDGREAAYSNHVGLIVDLEIGGRVNPTGGGDASLFQLASEMLDDGKQHAKKRRNGERSLSRLGLGAAAVAGLCTLPKPVNRRRMLRLSLGAGAIAALAPSLGFTLVSEVFVQNEITAFKQAARQLAELNRTRLA